VGTVQCEVVTDGVQNLDCKLLTDSGQTNGELISDSGQNVQCEVLSDSGQTLYGKVLTDIKGITNWYLQRVCIQYSVMY